MAFNPKNREIAITLIFGFGLLFALTNINQTLGNVYLWFTAGIMFLLLLDNKLTIPFQRSPGGHIRPVAYGVIGYISLLAVSSLVLKIFEPASSSIGSIISIIGASTPALAQSVFANFILLGLFVPFGESNLWIRAFEFVADKLGIKITKQNLTTFSVILLIPVFSFLFVIFHLTTKGIAAFAALVIIFIMMAISLILVILTQEARTAIYFHIIANSVAAFILLSQGAKIITSLILPII